MITLLAAIMAFSHTIHFPIDSRAHEIMIVKEEPAPFDELIVSWNGERPERGSWTFWISLKQGEWSPWLRYAEWTANSQKTFKSAPDGSFAETYQDGAYLKSGHASAFRIRVTADEGADLTYLDSIFACVSNLSQFAIEPPEPLKPILLSDVPRRSQIILDHPRSQDLCSPTSTSTALNYLLRENRIQPIDFAAKSHDDEWDIYGNWILNTAQAYIECETAFQPHVERLNSFIDLHAYLTRGLPVVVSIRGPIPGSPEPYHSGHLICIIGYDPNEERVYCVDSAFPDDASTYTSYALGDFLTAWSKRKNIAYVFPPKGP